MILLWLYEATYEMNLIQLWKMPIHVMVTFYTAGHSLTVSCMVDQERSSDADDVCTMQVLPIVITRL